MYLLIGSHPLSIARLVIQMGFSTLKPHSLVHKEAHEYQLQSDLKEQMLGYKRIRAQHKGQVNDMNPLISTLLASVILWSLERRIRERVYVCV